MRSWTKSQLFTYVSLLLLLVSRFLVADVVSNFARLLGAPISPDWLEGLRLIGDWAFSLRDKWTFALAGLVLIVNRGDPQRLNVDASFVSIFFLSGLVYFRFAYSEPWGWTAALVSVSIILLLWKGEFKFSAAEPSTKILSLITAIGAFSALLLLWVLGAIDVRAVGLALHDFLAQAPFWIVEEVVFRGMLWMLLRDLGWSAPRIVVFQAILFWLAHSYFMFMSPFFFWVMIPILSIVLGVLVWKTRSITPSTLGHMAINTLLVLIWGSS